MASAPWALPDDPPGESWPILSTLDEEVIPADAVFVLAIREPLPPDFSAMVRPLVDSFLADLDAEINRALDAYPEVEGQTYREVVGSSAAEMIENFGLDPALRLSAYGSAQATAIRLQLQDPEKFRLAAWKLGWNDRQAVFHGQPYWYIRQPSGELLVASVVGDHLVISLLRPGEGQREQMPWVLGQKLPRRSLAYEGTLDSLAEKRGLTSHVILRTNVEHLAGMYLAFAPGQSESCMRDAKRLLELTPSMVAGFSHISSDRLEISTFVELAPDTARKLDGLPGTVPGLAADGSRPEVSLFGAGFDSDGLRKLLLDLSTSVAEQPLACPPYAWINRAVAAASKLVNRRDYAEAGINGFNFSVDALPRGLAFHTAEAHVIFSATHPKVLLDSVLSSMDQRGSGRLGEAIRMTQHDGADTLLGPTYVFANSSSLSVSSGPDAKARLKAAVIDGTPGDGTLVVAGIDPCKVGGTLQRKLGEGLGGAIARAFRWIEANVRVVDGGLVLRSTLSARQSECGGPVDPGG